VHSFFIIICTGEFFESREIPEFKIENERIFPKNIQVAALFEPAMKWRLIEEYGINSFKVQDDGKMRFQSGFMDKEGLFGWLLSFGNQVELVEPKDLRIEFINLTKKITEKYE